MNQINLNNELLKSLSSLENAREKFFVVNLPNDKSLKIFLDKSGYEWVLRYKHKMIKRALNFKKALKSIVSDESFCFLCYFYEFVMPDIIMLYNILPKKPLSILNIGGGIGLFELFLNNLYGPEVKIDLIEVNKLLELDHHNKNIKSKELKSPLYVLDLAKTFLNKNAITNVNFIDSKNMPTKIKTPYDIVFSFRAWGFLFELREYINYVKNNLNKNGLIIIDVNKRTECKKTFENNFKNIKILEKYQAHYRLMGMKK